MEAADRIEEVVGAELYDKRTKYCVKTNSSDDLFRLLLHDEQNPTREQRESFQLLHGAQVTGSNRGLMLVGSNTDLMYAVDVDFDEELLEAYQVIMDYMYETFMKPFYECSVADLKDKLDSRIEQAIEHIDDLDIHSFWTNYMVWRALNVDVNRSNIAFPLPPSARCIPFQNAYWNSMKGKCDGKRCCVCYYFLSIVLILCCCRFNTGPSDTTTKLIDAAEEHVGVRTPRGIVTSRLLSIGSVCFHKCNQMSTAKLNRHSTIYACRHAANERMDMATSLDKLIRYLHEELKKALAATIPPGRVHVVAPNTPPRRPMRGHGTNELEKVQWGFSQQAGCTPCRGRAANDVHRQREQSCDDRVLLYRTSDPSKPTKDVRQPCRLCKAKTAFYCSGCKNWLCCGTQAITAKKAKMIVDGEDDSIPAPKGFIKIPFLDKEEQWNNLFAMNSCYHVSHKEAFNEKHWNME